MTRKLDLNALLLFFEVVNARSISSAAKKLEIPKSTISRKLMFLEDQLGAVLFKKGGRKLAVTDIGQALYEHCERIAARDRGSRPRHHPHADRIAGNAPRKHAGRLRHGLAQRAIAAFAVSYPDIHLVIDANSRWIDVSVEPMMSRSNSAPFRNPQRHPPPGEHHARRLCEPIVPRKERAFPAAWTISNISTAS